ncbi:DUF58 domain-containing protein [Brevibacillus sp. AF8]|uniref:DUF58 domain-containing protein n=1 Tax=Brevibacillus sp. AF8 TaxID=2825881 RepID=UPI001E48DBE3|nr:DUF58 domain-containing protein [Brevibacillus sp. AF8]MCE0452005.1 DUF58 domain-containing protein [Brevibacillus sp. AF8]
MITKQTFHVIGFVLLLFAVFSGHWFFFLFGGFFFFLPAAQDWWAKSMSKWVSLEWSSDQTRVLSGTPVPITVRLHNRSWLPLPATWLRFTLPEHVSVEGADEVRLLNHRTSVRLRFDLPMRQSATRTLILVPNKRGTVWLRDVQSETLPLLGEEPTAMTLSVSFSLLVYPLPLALSPVVLAESEPDGNRLSRQRQQDDPTFQRGVRSYMPGDRFKHIHWKATAKTGSLETRLFEYTAHPNWRIVGHILPSYEPMMQKYNDMTNERTISCLAALAGLCRRKSVGYELYLTVKQRGREHFHLPAGNGKAHHLHVMTQLAQIHHFVTTPLAPVLRRLEGAHGEEAILIVTPRMDPSVQASAERLIQYGHQVAVLDVSSDPVTIQRFEHARLKKRSVVMG